MFLIDKPYVSDFLIHTLKENSYPVVATKVAKELIADASLNWIREEEAIASLKNNPSQRIYSNSENALSWIDKHLGETELSKQIKGILSVEMSSGQMVEDVRLSVDQKIKVDHYGRTGGIIPAPEEIVEALKNKIIGG